MQLAIPNEILCGMSRYIVPAELDDQPNSGRPIVVPRSALATDPVSQPRTQELHVAHEALAKLLFRGGLLRRLFTIRLVAHAKTFSGHRAICQ